MLRCNACPRMKVRAAQMPIAVCASDGLAPASRLSPGKERIGQSYRLYAIGSPFSWISFTEARRDSAPIQGRISGRHYRLPLGYLFRPLGLDQRLPSKGYIVATAFPHGLRRYCYLSFQPESRATA